MSNVAIRMYFELDLISRCSCCFRDARGKHVITYVDGVLTISELTGQTDLPALGGLGLLHAE